MDNKFELIVQIFDEASLDKIFENLERLQKNNIKWLLIPPHHEYKEKYQEWYDRYAPLSYSIDEHKDFLKKLTSEAKKYDINIIIDLVFNHADPSVYEKEMAKNPNSFHQKNYADQTKAWFYNIFPSWNTEQAFVRNRAKKVIDELRDIGIKGFRFDAAPYMEQDFFDFLLKDSPKDELHIFEAKNSDPFELSPPNFEKTRDFIEKRIEARPTENTIFYDFRQIFNIFHLLKNHDYKNWEKSIYTDTIIPGHGLAVGTTHDEIMHNYNEHNQNTIYATQLVNFWSSPHKYGITTLCCNSAIANCFVWSWDTLENFTVPLIKKKNELKDISLKPVTVNPIIIGNNQFLSFNKDGEASFIFNLSHTEETIYEDKLDSQKKEELSLKDFGLSLNNLDTLWNKKILEKAINSKLHIPQRNFEIFSAKNRQENNNLVYPLHMFWYQSGELPEHVKKSASYWQDFLRSQEKINKKYHLKIWSRDDIFKLDLTDKETKILQELEKNFPKPDVYAAFSDIARLIVLSRFGGLYIDTDTNPRMDTDKLLSWSENGRSIILGMEPSGMINNAVIGCPINQYSQNNIAQLLDKIIDEYQISPTLDVIESTGPGIITKVVNNFDKNSFFIVPVNWMFLTWQDRKHKAKNFCTKHLTLVDHCYSGSWVSVFSQKNSARLNNGYYGYMRSSVLCFCEPIFLVFIFIIISNIIYRKKR